MIRQIATSSEYTTQALRATRPPKPQHLYIFDTHTYDNSYVQATQDEINSMAQESVRSPMSSIGTVNESVNNSLNEQLVILLVILQRYRRLI